MLRQSLTIALLSTPAQAFADDIGPEPDCGVYTSHAEIVRVIDGDTVIADIDLGFNVWLHNERLRLVGIDAPERGTEEGDIATQALSGRIAGKLVYVCTVKSKRSRREAKGSFGRYLATIYYGGVNLNHWMVEQGYAEPS